MNTQQIQRILSENSCTRQYFKGVYALDQLVKFKKYPASCVINYDSSDEPGSHWVAIFASAKSSAFYFDSFARPPLLAITTCFGKMLHNRTIVQSINSDACGHYCIVLIYFMSRGCPFQDAIEYLKLQDDKYIRQIVYSIDRQ